jgi:dTDP-glucose 4,6-dehydratase/UDP-glucose 4,6-dehydratase
MKKRYLITGGYGFIGSNYINYIHEHDPNAFIVNIDKLDYCANKTNVKCRDDPSKYVFIHKSICDKFSILNILNEHKITHLIHFAAQSHVDNSFEKALDYTMDNVYGTHCLLEASKLYGKLYLFLHFSTDEVYGESINDDKFHEQSILCPTNPYSATKAGAEMLVNSYMFSFKLPCIITRCNNVYGPNQYKEKLIPKFFYLLDNGKNLTIHGDGMSLRSFIHVYDVCTAIDLIIEKGVISEIYNIGSNDENEMTVMDVAKCICTYYKNGKYIRKLDSVEYISDRPFNDKRYFITNKKLKELGWDCTETLIDYVKSIKND